MAIELTLVGPAQQPLLVDGPVRFTTWLSNTGTEVVDAPDSQGPSPFVYRIYSAEDSHLICEASDRAKLASRPRLGNPPSIPASSIPLDPDEMTAYPADLADLITDPLPPGQYFAEVTLPALGHSVTSSRVRFEVVMSRPVAFAQALDGRRQRVILVEFHQDKDGGPVRLRQRRSESTLLDRFYDLHTFEPATPEVQQTALTIDSAYGAPENWRWIAWLDGNDLYCGASRKSDFLYPKGPVDLGFEPGARLMPHGYVGAGGSGMFLVTGLDRGDGQQHRKIRMVTIAPGNETQPVLTDLQLASVPADVIPEATLICAADGKRELVLYWRLQAGGQSVIAAGRFDPGDGAMLAKPERIFQTTRQIAASHAPPVVFVDGQAGDAFQLLLAPETGAEGRFTLVAIGVAGENQKREFDLPALDESVRGRVSSWVLPSNHCPGERAALVTSDGEIWFTDEARPAWRRIREPGEGLDAGSVRLWAFDARLAACTWFDRTRGYASVRV